ncbi:Nramp family divalent metal transporter [Psychrobacillus sp. BL-248-WT-3]|uniref:Nramp family divalent metal transporter n=1 Tax=Psychrobacillus sp. BL-248-WT-3 TaxID=2725306 RepID=UPI00146B341F|nr:Nramp family divalent metal transporter [Psychrobacillus sp. BL-248-WT-3]NME06971.1 Nramp family divalent metal transporter [Psychrobacillus sp. BL-248-WT-3]
MNEGAKIGVAGSARARRRSIFHYIGPALITSALMIGPGSITLSSKIGAIYGSTLVWTLVLAIVLMVVYTEMSARIGLAAKSSFITVIKEKWGFPVGLLIGVGAFLVTASFQAGNAIGTGLAISVITDLNPNTWIVVFTLISIALLFAKHFYQFLEKLMLALVVVMLIAFVITVFLAKPSIGEIFNGFIPALPEGSSGLIIALFATSFSIVGAVYQSYLVKEKGWGLQDTSIARRDSFLGIILLGIISFLIMITAATILKPQGLVVNDASEMGLALEPLFGSWSTVVFMLGLFGASFSSLMGNATIGGSLLADGVGVGNNLSNMKVKLFIILVILFGSVIGIVFGSAPLNLIVFAQAVTIFVVPFIAIAILVVANDKRVMGELKNKWLSNSLGIIGLLVLIYLAYNNANNIFFS